MSGFKKPITIKEAINKIHSRDFLLPAIQRKFIWRHEQIELLFDSIMRGYPINSFMFWEVRDRRIKSDYKFYSFLQDFREFFKEKNEIVNTNGISKSFYAVIDGQQRLNSLFIGLNGTYAYKIPYRRWNDNEHSIPTRELYLNIKKPIKQEHDRQKKYDFRFLSKKDLERLKDEDEFFWFKVGDILNFIDENDIQNYIYENSLEENDFAIKTLNKMFQRFNVEPSINYFLERDQNPDKVLEIFIRTNSGGTPLSFSDLLMSIASANWTKYDAREEIEDTINKVFNISNTEFRINKDFVLKTCLVLFTDDIRFQLKNFGYENVKIFEENWEKTKESIIATFTLMYRLGFDNHTFRAKNAAIPIIYYVYYNDLAENIVKANYDREDLANIKKWINLSFIKSIFSGQTDSVLKKIRNVLEENRNSKFPLEEIARKFEGDPNRNYSLSDEFIEELLKSPAGSNDTYYLLTFLYPDLDYYNQDFDVDHLHPASFFKDEENIKNIEDEKLKEYFSNEDYWNGVVNLQLLNKNLNRAKKDSNLKEWAINNNISNRDLYLDDYVDLDINNFVEFVENRKKNLKKKIKEELFF